MRKQLENLEILLAETWESVGLELVFCEIAPVSEKEAAVLSEYFGLAVAGFFHVIDNYALRHIRVRHGNSNIELSRGQEPVQQEDILLIPKILREFDELAYEFERNKHTLLFKKVISNRLYIYAAEVRSPRRRLICGQSLRILGIKKAD